LHQQAKRLVDSIQGAPQEHIIDFDELCVGGLFHVGGKHNVGDTGKDIRWKALAGEKVCAVASPFGL
jgi:hypothetical protein